MSAFSALNEKTLTAAIGISAAIVILQEYNDKHSLMTLAENLFFFATFGYVAARRHGHEMSCLHRAINTAKNFLNFG